MPEAKPPANRSREPTSRRFSSSLTSIWLDWFANGAKSDVAELQSGAKVVISRRETHETCRVVPCAAAHDGKLPAPAPAKPKIASAKVALRRAALLLLRVRRMVGNGDIAGRAVGLAIVRLTVGRAVVKSPAPAKVASLRSSLPRLRPRRIGERTIGVDSSSHTGLKPIRARCLTCHTDPTRWVSSGRPHAFYRPNWRRTRQLHPRMQAAALRPCAAYSHSASVGRR